MRMPNLVPSQGLVIIYIKSDWCADCAHSDVYWPYIEKMYPRATCLRINRDDMPEVTERFKPEGVPAYIVYQDSHEIARYDDKQRKTFEQVKTFLDTAIAKGSDR